MATKSTTVQICFTASQDLSLNRQLRLPEMQVSRTLTLRPIRWWVVKLFSSLHPQISCPPERQWCSAPWSCHLWSTSLAPLLSLLTSNLPKTAWPLWLWAPLYKPSCNILNIHRYLVHQRGSDAACHGHVIYEAHHWHLFWVFWLLTYPKHHGHYEHHCSNLVAISFTSTNTLSTREAAMQRAMVMSSVRHNSGTSFESFDS